MNAGELKDAFRLDAFDNVEPYLWGDEEIYRYMDDAHTMFCRLTGGLSDSTSSLTQITAKADTEFTALDHRILKIRLARRGTDFGTLDVADFEELINGGRVLDGYSSVPEISNLLNDTKGTIEMMVVNMEPNKVRWVPIPAADTAVKLTVYRLPIKCITDKDSVFEIDARHHLHLLKWMKHLAFGKQDAETFDRAKSQENAQLFGAYCDQCKAERERREHKYGRSVVYGGL